jgi:hypothetical protein
MDKWEGVYFTLEDLSFQNKSFHLLLGLENVFMYPGIFPQSVGSAAAYRRGRFAQSFPFCLSLQ